MTVWSPLIDSKRTGMATYSLDFEKPLLELEKQIEELKGQRAA